MDKVIPELKKETHWHAFLHIGNSHVEKDMDKDIHIFKAIAEFLTLCPITEPNRHTLSGQNQH